VIKPVETMCGRYVNAGLSGSDHRGPPRGAHFKLSQDSSSTRITFGGARLSDMEPSSFESWLEKYGSAWKCGSPQAAADLFTHDGTYQVTPFVEPMRGRAAIFKYWCHVAETERNVQFGYEVLAVTPEASIARWWASFLIVPQMLHTKLYGIFLVSLDDDGRCKSLREWWHKQQH